MPLYSCGPADCYAGGGQEQVTWWACLPLPPACQGYSAHSRRVGGVGHRPTPAEWRSCGSHWPPQTSPTAHGGHAPPPPPSFPHEGVNVAREFMALCRMWSIGLTVNMASMVIMDWYCHLPFSAPTEVPTFMSTFNAGSEGLHEGQPATQAIEGRVSSQQKAHESKGGSPDGPTSVPGMALVLQKLVQKILKGEFIDMCELLPETWRVEETRDSCCRSNRPKRGLITDITLWTECYALLLAVLATKFPEKTPHFMCYLRTIVRASRNFEGTAWASYDAAYQRQAANRQSLDWATIDPTI